MEASAYRARTEPFLSFRAKPRNLQFAYPLTNTKVNTSIPVVIPTGAQRSGGICCSTAPAGTKRMLEYATVPTQTNAHNETPAILDSVDLFFT
jgi:hypothetical protein